MSVSSHYFALVLLSDRDGSLQIDTVLDSPFITVTIHDNESELKGLSAHFEIADDVHKIELSESEKSSVEAAMLVEANKLNTYFLSHSIQLEDLTAIERSLNKSITEQLGYGEQIACISQKCIDAYIELSIKLKQ